MPPGTPTPTRAAPAGWGRLWIDRSLPRGLPGARPVANPAAIPPAYCWPFAADAGDMPIAGPIIADSASGVSGADRSPTATTFHFVQVAGNYLPYKIVPRPPPFAGDGAGLAPVASRCPPLLFSPHLLPVRGISTMDVTFAGGVDKETTCAPIRHGLMMSRSCAAGRATGFAGRPTTQPLRHRLTLTGRTLILTAAIDNLINQGAAGRPCKEYECHVRLPGNEWPG